MDVEPPEDTYARFRQNTHPFRYHLTAHRGNAAVLAGNVPDGLDLLFIDGDHSYEGATADLSHYVPKLKPGGFLLMHDFTYDTVQRAARDFFGAKAPSDKGSVHSLKIFQT
jgi:predicted O-methyltransferase YrrM